MERGRVTVWCLLELALVAVLLPECYSVEVAIYSYTHNSTLTTGDPVPHGTQIILVCRVVGLPYGTPLSYTWACPNGPCEVEGYYGRKVYNEYILAVNATSTSDGGTYTCQGTATGGQEATGNFILRVTGGIVVHSYGRLIPHEFPITDLQQISGSDGIGRITCTNSSGTATFIANGGHLETGGVSQTNARNGATATLVVNPSNVDSFQNRQLYCTDINTNFLFLFISSANPLTVPSLTVVTVTESKVEYQITRSDGITNAPLITGYEVTRFGVPMIGQYVNTGRGKRVTISPAVPGAQYRITAWALGDGRRSATPAVVDNTTREAGPSSPRSLSITREFQNGIELNWLSPTEPNGEVHYVIYYTPEGGTEQSIDTGSDLTHHNLTGLERNRVYTNIAVQANNSAGRSGRSAVIAQYNHTPPNTSSTGSPHLPGPSSTTGSSASTGRPSAVPSSPTQPSTRRPSTTHPSTTQPSTTTPSTTQPSTGRPSTAPPSTTQPSTTTPSTTQPSTGRPSTAPPSTAPPSTAALAAGVVVALLVVVVLLSLMGGVLAVVLWARRKKMREAGQSSHAKAEDNQNEEEINNNTYQNVQSQPTSSPGDEVDYTTTADAFVNPASATASFKTHMCESIGNLDQEPTEVCREGVYEEARLEWEGGQCYEEPVKSTSRKQKKSAAKKVNIKPEDLYAQPSKVKKKDAKKDNQIMKSDNAAAPSDDLYAQPDMTKKKYQSNQQDSEQERKIPPQAPLPYKKHKEAKHESEGDEEDIPELPPPYVSAEEQYYNTRGGDGPSSMERQFEYAVLEWHKK